MNLLSLIFGIIAAVLFILAAKPWPNPPRWSLVPLGLFFSILCFMAQLLILVSDPITISKP